MTDSRKIDARVVRVAKKLARTLAEAGAEAVVLVGSFLRGDAHRESDIDLIVLGRGPEYWLERHDRFLVSNSWRTPAQIRQAFREPSELSAVPGWQKALIMHDPKGIAARLQREARSWAWERISKRCDEWVAEQVTGYAEDVQKLVGSLERGQKRIAAAYRSVLATRLTSILAVHHRILYDGDNELFTKVAARLGEHWHRVQGVALQEGGESFQESWTAALELYTLAANEVRHLLDERQYAVVAHACDVAGHPLRGEGGRDV